MQDKTKLPVSEEDMMRKIVEFRGNKVMIDRDLAILYGVSTKRLKEQVRRNIERFPEHFMFELTEEENLSLRSHFATLKKGEHSKYLPYAFTEHGILQLANVLRSKQAIKMSIRIINLFIKMREILNTNKDILMKLDQLENQVGQNTGNLRELFEMLRQIINTSDKARRPIGYNTNR